MKKVYPILLFLVTSLSFAYAENPSGTCGENLFWEIKNDTLYILGTGDMENFEIFVTPIAPWKNYTFHYAVVGDSVTSIGTYAFYESYNYNSNLRKIFMGKNIRKIAHHAFCNCGQLESFSIPDSVTTIEEYTFFGCAMLKTLTVGKNFKSCSNSAFRECYRLKSIIWNAKNCTYVCSGITTGTTYGYDYDHNTTVEYELMSYDMFNFPRSQITSVTFGNEVEHIPAYLCLNMTNIKSITIPNNVVCIGPGAFNNSGFFNKNSNWENGVLYIDDCLIKANDTLSGNYSIKEGTRLIADDAFYLCPNLLSINGTDALRIIGNGSFESCNLLQSVSNISKITNIGSGAFAGCSSLTSFNIPGTTEYVGASAFEGCTNLSSVTLSESLDSINNSTFKDCAALHEIVIPENIKSLGEEAFANCDTLKHILLGSQVQYIKQKCFYDCAILDSILLPSHTELIEESAFSNCPKLRYIKFNDNLKSIGKEAFIACGIDSLLLPSGISTIENGAFCVCRQLKYAVLPDSLEIIKPYVFSGDTALKEVTIGEKIVGFQPFSFNNCKNIKTLHWNAIYFENSNSFQEVKSNNATIVTLGDKVKHIPTYFSLCCANTYINIPASVESIGKYAFSSSLDTVVWNPIDYPELLSSSPFSSTVSHFEFGDGVEKIPNYLCQGLSVDSIILPASVRHIGKGSFSNCLRLKQILLSESLSTIDTVAFKNCRLLNIVKIPNNLKSIAYSAFESCTDLAFVDFGNSIETIGMSAFNGCWNMRYVDFPECLKTIEPWAFSGCTNINRIILHPIVPPTCQNSQLPQGVPTYIPCGTYTAYSQSDWTGYQLQYTTSAYTITAQAEQSTMGYVQVTNPASACEAAKIEAFPYEGYDFVQWSDGNTDNPREIFLTQDITLTAMFTSIETDVDIIKEIDLIRCQKILHDGHILIFRGNKTYTIQGQEFK